MRYIGIDWGEKRVGIAQSDELGKFAFPDRTLSQNEVLEYLKKLANDDVKFVLGMPSAKESPETVKKVNEFKETLALLTGRPVHTVTEEFSSFEAHGRMGKESLNQRQTGVPQKDRVDEKAAAIILERFLSRLNI